MFLDVLRVFLTILSSIFSKLGIFLFSYSDSETKNKSNGSIKSFRNRKVRNKKIKKECSNPFFDAGGDEKVFLSGLMNNISYLI